jgi:hypothetical protein
MLIVLAGSASAQNSSIDVGTALVPAASPNVKVKLGDTTTSTFRILDSNSAELLRVQADGNVSIGPANPSYRLHVNSIDNANTIVAIENTNAGLSAASVFRAISNGAQVSMFAHGSGQTQVNRFGLQMANYSEILTPTGNGLIVGTSIASPLIFGTNNVERMRIDSSGRVGIGTGARVLNTTLDVLGDTRLEGDVFLGQVAPVTLHLWPDSSGAYLRGYGGAGLEINGQGPITLSNSNVLIGSHSYVPTSLLQIGGANYAQFKDNVDGAPGIDLIMPDSSRIEIGGLTIAGTGLSDIQSNTGNALYLNRATGGAVEIGSNTIPGNPPTLGHTVNLNVHGAITGTTIYSNYQDLAEWVPAAETMPPGTVVVLSDNVANTVTTSKHAYDTGVAGVVSPSPGLLLGIEGPSKAKIATIGRVKVRVDATKGPIRIGDLLVTSDRPGLAMKSEPLDLGGAKIHRPGTLIGKALEPLPGGEGEILVLLSLQ